MKATRALGEVSRFPGGGGSVGGRQAIALVEGQRREFGVESLPGQGTFAAVADAATGRKSITAGEAPFAVLTDAAGGRESLAAVEGERPESALESPKSGRREQAEVA